MTCCAKRRDIFLKIEPVVGYSPLSPDPCARRWGRDEMFNMGHELGRVQASEIVATTLDALVYREYFDSHHTKPNTAKLIEADVNEPVLRQNRWGYAGDLPMGRGDEHESPPHDGRSPRSVRPIHTTVI